MLSLGCISFICIVILFGRDFRFQFGSYEFSISTFSSAFRGSIGDVNPTILA
jgi:hypothetical protein